MLLAFCFFSSLFSLGIFTLLVSLGEFRYPKRYPFFFRDLFGRLFSEAFGFPPSPFPHRSLSCFFFFLSALFIFLFVRLWRQILLSQLSVSLKFVSILFFSPLPTVVEWGSVNSIFWFGVNVFVQYQVSVLME